MKTEVVTWDGSAKIILYAENDFERRLIEDAKGIKPGKKGYTLEASLLTDYGYQNHSNHRIEIYLTEKKAL